MQPRLDRRIALALRLRGARSRELLLALLGRFLPSESQHLFALTLAVGVVCGLVAVAFHLAIKGAEALLIDRALGATGNSWMAWTLVSPTLGGLVAGLLLTYVVPGARGSGIPQVKAAFALEGGRVRVRDAFGKFWLAALQIGSGASLGREGPTVQICAGATSLLARLTALPAKNIRRLLPVGVAAGIAAAFNAPIAAVTFTIEEVVGSLDHAVLSGVVVAAALAAVIERSVLGVHPIIEVQEVYGLDHASSLVFFAILGLAGGLVAVAFTDGLLRVRLAFRRLEALPPWSHPAVGGLATGALAVLSLKFLGTTGVTGGGYDTLGRALAGQLGLDVLLALCAIKVVATVMSYSSGGAGGIFAPSLFVGAMLGGAVGYLDVALLHHESKQLGAFALVGMGAVFAGVIRAPITSVLIIFEMTGGYGLVLPLMLANMTAYGLARRLRPVPIYEALLAQDGVVLPHGEKQVNLLERQSVRDAMTTHFDAVHPEALVGDCLAALADKAYELVPAVDQHGLLLGAVRLAKLRTAPGDSKVGALVQPAETILADAPLPRAIVRMNDLSTRQLVVLDERDGSRVVGVLTIADVLRAHARLMTAPAAAQPGSGPFPAADARELRAASLMRAGPTLAPEANLAAVLEALARSPSGVVVVEMRSSPGVILLEHLREFLMEPQLRSLLVAVDLATPVRTVGPDATLPELVSSVAETSAVLVEAGSPSEERQVVTRAALGGLLLDWYSKNVRE